MSIPRHVGHYQIGRKLGEGGMGVVYQAVDQHSNVCVAIKVMKPEIARDADAKRRFRREVRVLHDLKHPNILSAIDSGDIDGAPYFVMCRVQRPLGTSF